jgi:hypothetical protein
MATKRKSSSRKAKAKADGPTVYYLADADAKPVEAVALNAPEDSPLTGYENLSVQTKDGTFENVPGDLGGPGVGNPRWRLSK